jgi:hypothetical protein
MTPTDPLDIVSRTLRAGPASLDQLMAEHAGLWHQYVFVFPFCAHHTRMGNECLAAISVQRSPSRLLGMFIYFSCSV